MIITIITMLSVVIGIFIVTFMNSMEILVS